MVVACQEQLLILKVRVQVGNLRLHTAGLTLPEHQLLLNILHRGDNTSLDPVPAACCHNDDRPLSPGPQDVAAS